MYRVLTGGLLSAVVAFGLASGANAQQVQKSGKHIPCCAVCGPVPAGFARCGMRHGIVTDSSGHEMQSDEARASAALVHPICALRTRSRAPASPRPSSRWSMRSATPTPKPIWEPIVRTSALSSCTTANGCFKKLDQNGVQGSYPAQNIGWAQESALDVDMASAMCPKCQVWLVEANTNSFSDLATAVNTAASLGAHVISNSYGGGEGGSDSAYNHANIAITASTGDNGFAAGPQFPATSP